MRAFLKNIYFSESNDVFHPISMQFAASMDSDELYAFPTTMETQFCAGVTLSDKQYEEKANYAKSLIGREFEVNLYKFTVKEITNGRYEAFEDANYIDFNTQTIKEFRIASYMSKDDVIAKMKYTLCMQSINGDLEGVLRNGSKEKVSTDLFFKKTYNIHYANYWYINESYIISKASIHNISNGHYLAKKIKDYDINENDFINTIQHIETFRSKVKQAQEINNSLRKKIFFWEPKEVVDELKLDSAFVELAKDCIILYDLYHDDCADALSDEVNKRFGSYTEGSIHREKMIEFVKALSKKYEWQKVLKLL